MRRHVSPIIVLAALILVSCTKPAHYVVLFDTSRSMNADMTLDNAKEELIRFVKGLTGENDELSLLTFDSDVTKVFSDRLSKSRRESLFSLIRSIKATGDWTYIYLVQQAGSASVYKILVVTDGINDPPPGIPKDGLVTLDDIVGKHNDLAQRRISSHISFIFVNSDRIDSAKLASFEQDLDEAGFDTKIDESCPSLIDEIIPIAKRITGWFLVLCAIILAIALVIFWRIKACRFPDLALCQLSDSRDLDLVLGHYSFRNYRKGCAKSLQVSKQVPITGLNDDAFKVHYRSGEVYLESGSEDLFIDEELQEKGEKIHIRYGTVFIVKNMPFTITNQSR